MISNFPANPLVNFAGLQAFKFAPYPYIAQLPVVSGRKVTAAVTFKDGFAWLDGYATIGQLKLDETPASDEHGTPYDLLVTGFYPGDSDIVLDLFQEMERWRHIVLTNDNNGIMRLVGYDAPLTFNASYSSGQQAGSDAKGFTFTFSARAKKRAPVYKVA